jgi:pyrimidine-nucleoside phosphorylase
MYDLIKSKRDGRALNREEIFAFVRGYTAGKIPDYQAAALMMAIFFRGMTAEETLNLTLAMAQSGDMLDLSALRGIKVDKHSTGGVGDKTSLVLAPLVAACGVPVAKMSGRGLGHTGGTIDKLESFEGFRTGLTGEEFLRNVNRIGIAIMGQTADLAPADRKLYALRDVTATVDSRPLIASSVMSKKLAAGADAIVLDVKTGGGAFLKKEEDAIALAEEMVRIGNQAGRETVAAVTDMDQPLGFAVGNALEVKEAIDALQGKGPADFVELCLTLGSQMLLAGKAAREEAQAREKLETAIRTGAALEKLAQWVEAQGGKKEAVFDTGLLPRAALEAAVLSEEDGYVRHIECEEVGLCSLLLGGGRETKDSPVDLSVGLVLHKKAGDPVRKGESLATVHANDRAKAEEAKEKLRRAYSFCKEKQGARKLVKALIR